MIEGRNFKRVEFEWTHGVYESVAHIGRSSPEYFSRGKEVAGGVLMQFSLELDVSLLFEICFLVLYQFGPDIVS